MNFPADPTLVPSAWPENGTAYNCGDVIGLEFPFVFFGRLFQAIKIDKVRGKTGLQTADRPFIALFPQSGFMELISDGDGPIIAVIVPLKNWHLSGEIQDNFVAEETGGEAIDVGGTCEGFFADVAIVITRSDDTRALRVLWRYKSALKISVSSFVTI